MFIDQLIICGVVEVDDFRHRPITHIVSIRNPGARIEKLPWFKGAQLELFFGDVFSEADAFKCNTKAPTTEDIRRTIEFTGSAWQASSSLVLFHCDYGASRSPALAYVALAHTLGQGMEFEAFETITSIQPCSVPNKLVVQLGDAYLKRNGLLLQPLLELYQRLNNEIEGRG